MIRNKLLLRQLQKHFGGLQNVPAEMQDFLTAVNESYDHYEKDHQMLERCIDLSSGEMIALNQELQEETKKLKSAHYELQMLFDNIDEIFFSVDMKAFKLIQMSASCEKTYGYTREEFYASNNLWQDTIHPDDKHISQQQLGLLYSGKKVLNQYRIIHKNGSERWLENKVIPTLDEKGTLVRIDGISSDITERKKAEALILESEEKYRLVFENPFLGVAIGTIEGNMINANKAFYSLLGYTREEIQDMHFSRFSYAPDVEKEQPLIIKMATGKIDNYQLEKRYITKSNEIIWVDLSVSCVKNEKQEILFVIAVVQNITAKVQAKQLLLKSEANLRNILENTDTAYVLLDTNADILSYNRIALQMSYNELKEPIAAGKNYPALMLEDKKAGIKATIDHVLATGKPVKYEAYYPHEKSGTWLYVSFYPILNEEKRVIGLSVAATDITDRKKSEILIHQSNQRYELVTKATKDIIWDWDIASNEMFRSSNYQHVFGHFNPDNLYTGPWTARIHPEDRERVQSSIAQKINDPSFVLWEENYRYFRASGEIAHVQDRGYIIRNEENAAVRMVGAMRDVTDEKTLSDERDKITSDLSQRNRDLEQFAFIVSHNLRTPVANIIGLMNLLQNHPGLDAKEKKQCMDGLLLSTVKLDNVIRDMNHILQVRHQISERKEPVLFSELVEDIKISIQNLFQQEDAVIQTDFSELNECFTLKSYMYSIFFNLISNSIKYRNGATPVISICSRRINNKVLLTFKDNGLGIDLATQEHKIFGLYNKFHFHTEGKGMGLYMTKTQVEILGGKISVKSCVNEGTEFFVELPV